MSFCLAHDGELPERTEGKRAPAASNAGSTGSGAVA
jgi:hypothetical protein